MADWMVAVSSPEDPERALASAELDPRGAFRVELARAGTYELRLWLPSYAGPRIRLRQELELHAGGNAWLASFASAVLVPRSTPGTERLPAGLHYVWIGETGLACEIPLGAPELSGGAELRVPAGAARIVECLDATCDPRRAPALVELELDAGETRTLELE